MAPQVYFAEMYIKLYIILHVLGPTTSSHAATALIHTIHVGPMYALYWDPQRNSNLREINPEDPPNNVGWIHLIIKEPIFYLTFNKRSVGPPSAKALMLNVHKHGKFFDLQVAEGQLPHPYHL